MRVIWPPSRVVVEMPGAADADVKPSPDGGVSAAGFTFVCGVLAPFAVRVLS
jgi:hypothetical protein